MIGWRTVTLTAVVLTGLSVGSVRAESPAPTDGEWASYLLEQTLLPVDRAALRAEASLLAIRVVDPGGNMRDTAELADAIGNFFWDRGYEVQVLEPRAEIEEGALLLDLTVDAADFDEPARAGSFLGLGGTKVLRRAVLAVHGRLEDPRSGRWYWRGAPTTQVEAWIAEDELVPATLDRPAWAGAVPVPSTAVESPWWERLVVGGLLAGVITLYVGGSN